MPHQTALVTLLAVAVYFATSIIVARARRRTGIEVPATTGHPEFERAFRVQMNTLEAMPIFLPSLWLAALYVGDRPAAVMGAIWIAGRVLYVRGYLEAAEKRGLGFGIQAAASMALWGMSLWGVAMTLLRS